MSGLWPWLTVAGLGALHGLNPATGWLFAAAGGIQARDGTRVGRALRPIAAGHAASIAVVAALASAGMVLDRALLQGCAGALLIAGAACRQLRRIDRHLAFHAPSGGFRLALLSFLMASAHGAGMMLVPAIVPLCMADNPAREITASGSLLLALAAVTLHTAALLVTVGAVARGAVRCVVPCRSLDVAVLDKALTLGLALTGVALIVWR